MGVGHLSIWVSGGTLGVGVSLVNASRVLAISGYITSGVLGALTLLFNMGTGAAVAGFGVPAALGIAAEVQGHRAKRAEDKVRQQDAAAAAKEEDWKRSAISALRWWPLPPLADVDAVDVGVHRPRLPGG